MAASSLVPAGDELPAGARRPATMRLPYLVALATALALAIVSFILVQKLLAEEQSRDLRVVGEAVATRFETHLRIELDKARALSRNALVSNILLAPVVGKPFLAPVLQEWCANGFATGLILRDFEGQPLLAGCSPRFVSSDEAVHAAAAAVATGTIQQRSGKSGGRHWLYLALPVLNPPTGAAEGTLEVEFDLDALLATELGPHDAAKPIASDYHVGLRWVAASVANPARTDDDGAGIIQPVGPQIDGSRLAVTASIAGRRFDEAHNVVKGVFALVIGVALASYWIALKRIEADARRHLTEEDLRLRDGALAASHNAVLIVAPDRRLAFTNPAFLRLTGFDRESIEGARWPDILIELVGDRAAAAQALQRGRDPARLRILPRHGGRAWVDMTVTPFRDERGLAHGLVVMSDISRRVASEERYQALVDQIGEVICQLDAGGRIVFLSRAWERLTAFAPEECIGENILRFAHPEEIGWRRQRLAQLLAGECDHLDYEARFQTRSGDYRWLAVSLRLERDACGIPLELTGTLSDVTSRKASESMLRESLTRLNVISTLSPDAFISFDACLTLDYLNPAAERMLGMSHSELHGMALGRFEETLREKRDPAYPWPALPGGLLKAEDAAAAGAHAGGSHILRLRLPGPRAFQRSWRRSNSETATLTFYLRDITPEMEVNQMKSQFLSTAAHELRSPMASIYGFSELLLLRRFSEERTRDVLTTINRQARRLSNLIGDLLDLARIEERRGQSFVLQTLDPAPLIRDTVAANVLPDDPHEVDLDLAPTLPLVRIDGSRLQQALINLLSNACKYSPGNTRIAVDTVERQQQGQRQLGIRVRDEGIGMNPDELAHAFERFYRADESGHIPGTGLGLAVVKEIMHIHGGSAELQSQVGVGTTATLWLPVAEAAGAISEPHPPTGDNGAERAN
jgi:PAS domain S-box-containing protein